MANKRTELIEKYREAVGYVADNNLINDNSVDLNVAFDMLKANAEAKPENRLYNVPEDWTEEKYAEFLEDCKELD